MIELELIGVPFDGYGRRGHQAKAAEALREAGLHRLIDGSADDDDISLPPPDPSRGAATSLINEGALVAMTDALNARVAAAVGAGRFPVVYGGDCSMLLGIVTGLRDLTGRAGLVFVDGHEDTMPLDVSEDGEAANTEIGLLLGVTGRLLSGPLADRLPALNRSGLALLGQRDEGWRRQFNVGALAEMGVWSRDLSATAADPSGSARAAAEHVRGSVEQWWLHIDLDVLDPDEMPAQGLPDVVDEPGGLHLDQLGELVDAAITVDGCSGLSIAIYDPDQDPDRAAARRIVALVSDALDALDQSRSG